MIRIDRQIDELMIFIDSFNSKSENQFVKSELFIIEIYTNNFFFFFTGEYFRVFKYSEF